LPERAKENLMYVCPCIIHENDERSNLMQQYICYHK